MSLFPSLDNSSAPIAANAIAANNDLSPAERALRDQYCGHLDVSRHASQMPETVIADPHAFEHNLHHSKNV